MTNAYYTQPNIPTVYRNNKASLPNSCRTYLLVRLEPEREDLGVLGGAAGRRQQVFGGARRRPPFQPRVRPAVHLAGKHISSTARAVAAVARSVDTQENDARAIFFLQQQRVRACACAPRGHARARARA